MKSASIRALHMRTSHLVAEAAKGAVILIERHGEPVAELRPISKKYWLLLPDMTDIWRRFPSVAADSGRFLEQDR